jgi:hypothetical protein
VIRTLVVAALALAIAGAASAGGDTPPFGSPFGFPCPDDFAGAILEDPNAFVAVGDAELCTKLCKQTAKECKAWAKRALKCKSKVFVGAAAYQKVACSALLEGADDDCRDLVNEQRKLTALSVKSDLETFTADCESWGEDCEAECLAP